MKRPASYTMRDVARIAHVSVTTLSTVVNGRGGDGEGSRVVLKAELQIRGSTAPPASLASRPQQNSIPLNPSSSEATVPVASRPVEQSSAKAGQIIWHGKTS